MVRWCCCSRSERCRSAAGCSEPPEFCKLPHAQPLLHCAPCLLAPDRRIRGCATTARRRPPCRRHPLDRRSHHRHEEDRRLLPALLGRAGGRLFLEVPKLDTEVLHSTGFGTGLGSNDIGLDRGALAGSRIVKFERVGPRVLMVQPNYQFRATSNERRGSARRRRRVRAVGALGLPDRRRQRRPRARRRHRLPPARRQRRGRPAAARLVPLRGRRSAVYMPMTMGFPKNTEMEVELTFVRQPGAARGWRRARRRPGWRRRRFPRGRRQRGRDRRSREHARASLVRRAARRQLQAARRRSARRLLRRRRTRTTRRRSASR